MALKQKLFLFAIFFVAILILASSFAFAKNDGEEKSRLNLKNPVFWIIIVSIWLVIVTIISIVNADSMSHGNKKIAFWIMVIPVVLASLYLAGDTVYNNLISVTGGPVHWHADYEVIVCGERLFLIEPRYLNNKIGSPLLHSHEDDRIHAEGTILSLDDVTLGHYFEDIGGELTEDAISYPLETETITKTNGDLCGNSAGTLKVYVNGKRIENFTSYVMYPNSYVPPGDCIIIYFDSSNAETTDKLCESWQAKGWNYESFERKAETIGDRSWQ